MAMTNSNAQMDCCSASTGSTHELVYDQKGGGTVFWVSGQMYDCIACVQMDGTAQYFPMNEGGASCGPHGMRFDASGHLWVTLEWLGELARVETDKTSKNYGTIVQRVDVNLYAKGAPVAINTHPHGLGLAADGALWFTGKLTNTVGRVDAQGNVSHFELPTIGAVPIYLSPGPDGNMWCTELASSKIAQITNDGKVTEFTIPTGNSRPIAIVASPDGKAMWWSEEAGGKVGRIGMEKGNPMVEFSVPLASRDAILAGLAFDSESRLWVQQYSSPPAMGCAVENDYIVRLGAELLQKTDGDLTGVPIDYFKAPSKGTVMHRITQGPDKAMWFSELGINRIGRIALSV